MPEFEVLRSYYASIQDLGRVGYRSLGVPVSGALDKLSHAYANALVGNSIHEATIEVIGGMFEFRMLEEAIIAVTGAEAEVRVNDKRVDMWRPLWIGKDSRVTITAVRKGFIVYVGFAGGLRVKKVMRSKSTYYRAGFGGYDGRLLKPGDRVSVGKVNLDGVWEVVAGKTAPDCVKEHIPTKEGAVEVRVTRGVHYDLLSDEFEKLLSAKYVVTSQLDRMGYRLDGPVLERAKSLGRLISIATDRGYIQVPPNGKPIVLMSDSQTTGGYAVIAHVIPRDVDKVAQCGPGYIIRFRELSVERAERDAMSYYSMLERASLTEAEYEEEYWGEML